MGPRQIKQHCKLSDDSQELIRVAMTELNLTPAPMIASSKSPALSPISPNPIPSPPSTSAKRFNIAPSTGRFGFDRRTGNSIEEIAELDAICLVAHVE
jgi:hypothetical protein